MFEAAPPSTSLVSGSSLGVTVAPPAPPSKSTPTSRKWPPNDQIGKASRCTMNAPPPESFPPTEKLPPPNPIPKGNQPPSAAPIQSDPPLPSPTPVSV